MLKLGLRASRFAFRAARNAGRQVVERVASPRFPSGLESMLDGWRSEEPPSKADYEDLLCYFAEGWRTFRTASGSGARYRGLPSTSGSRVDQMEGFSRIMPLFGAWCAGGRSPALNLADGTRLDLVEEFTRGVLAGTDPSSPGFWGGPESEHDQRIVEAADVALALWLFRESAWRGMSDPERERVGRWLASMDGKAGFDNNWHLFFVLIDRVLEALGSSSRLTTARDHYQRIKDFHLGDGWFEDGSGGRVDYYNAWGFHYPLYWIDRIDPAWDPDYIRRRQHEFLSTYRYLIGPEGFPVLGRSICYRMAAVAPLAFGQRNHPDVVSPGEARRALDSTWKYFIRNGALREGVATQGYFGPDPRILDNYSGPASPLWSVRSLVVAFEEPDTAPIWTADPALLPVEQGNYEMRIQGTGWTVRGDHPTRTISIEICGSAADAKATLEPFGIVSRLRGLANDTPRRPRNMEAKYLRGFYESDPPFCC